MPHRALHDVRLRLNDRLPCPPDEHSPPVVVETTPPLLRSTVRCQADISGGEKG